MKERLPRLLEAELDEEQLAIYRSITAGPRASGKQAFPLTDDAGSLKGPFGVMLHAPRLGAPLQELGAAIRYQTILTAREREIAILMVAVATDSAFEWYAHERVGRAVGLTEDDLSAIRGGDFPRADPREATLGLLCAALLRVEHVEAAEFDGYSSTLGHQAVIELIVLVGYYRTLAQMMDVFQIEAPAD